METKQLATEKSSRPKIVLLAEDDDSMRRFLEVVLRRAGYQVVSAENGAAAMQLTATLTFDVVVLDAMMPIMTGYELTRILRAQPHLRHIPIVIMSGLESEAVADADARLLKSSNLQDELLAVLAKLVGEQNEG